MRYFWSDPHFAHANILKFEPNRKEFLSCSTIEEHDEALINLYNKVVKPSDTCYFLGDVCFDKTPATRDKLLRLNGTKILIRGNHDAGHSDGFFLSAGFTAIVDECIISIGKAKVRLSHYPYYPSWWVRLLMRLHIRKPIRALHKRPKNDGKWLLHGHIHSAAKNIPWNKQIHVGLDSWKGRPISADKILDIIRTQYIKEYLSRRPILLKIKDKIRSKAWRLKNFFVGLVGKK